MINSICTTPLLISFSILEGQNIHNDCDRHNWQEELKSTVGCSKTSSVILKSNLKMLRVMRKQTQTHKEFLSYIKCLEKGQLLLSW